MGRCEKAPWLPSEWLVSGVVNLVSSVKMYVLSSMRLTQTYDFMPLIAMLMIKAEKRYNFHLLLR